MDKETIEKDAKELWKQSHPNPIEMAMFGVKWQKDRSYSEEEVVEICAQFHKRFSFTHTVRWKDFFEQFKK